MRVLTSLNLPHVRRTPIGNSLAATANSQQPPAKPMYASKEPRLWRQW
jgi:hypothetical protein